MKSFKIHTYNDLLEYDIEKKDSIPKIIFRTSHYKVESLPEDVVNLYKTEFEKNKNYELFYFDDDDCEKLINDTNNKDLIFSYNTLKAGAYKADIIRYLLMYKYGGVYMDFTMNTLKPLDEIIKSYDLVLVKDLESSLGGIYNAFICSKSGNPLFINLIDSITKNIKNRVYFDNVWELTGPIALRKEFYKNYNCEQISIGDFDKNTYIYKLIDTGLINNQHYISDLDGDIVIETRLANHYTLLYNKEKVSYTNLFVSKNIYKNLFNGYSEFKKYVINSNSDSIPNIIFRTGSFILDEIPKEIQELYNDTLSKNDGYEMFYFDDNDRLNFIKDNYPDRYVNAYKKLIPKAYQADLFRYLVLYKFGGVYMDFSMSPIVPLENILKSYKEIYVRDRPSNPTIYNAFIATVKGSEILKSCIEKCLINIETENYGYDTLCITSPIILGEAIVDYDIEGIFVDGMIQVGEINPNLYIYSFEYGDEEFFKNPETNQFVVKNKIENHYNILYKNNFDILRYHNLWEKRMAFKDSLFIEIEDKYKEITKKNIGLLTAVYIYNKCKNGHSLEENISRVADIIKLYNIYLKREADEGGLANYFSSSMSIDDIKKAIMNSEEYNKI